MKYLLTLLLIAPLMAISQTQQWVDATGDTIRVEKRTAYGQYSALGVLGVRDSIVSFTIKVPVYGTVKIPYSYQYDTVVVIRKASGPVDPDPEEPGTVDPPPISNERFDFSVSAISSWDGVSIPFAKAEVWSGQWIAPQPYSAADKYFRFSWSMLESAQGQYNWSRFDSEINNAINNGQKFSFGIMTHYPDAVSPHRLNYDGGYSVYPQYLHNLMQSESVKDWKAPNGAWVPNWNSEAYLTRLLALHSAITEHLYTTQYKGIYYKDAINYIDVRGFGAFGEWHGYTIVDVMSQYPAGTRATESTLKRIIDIHVQGFPDWPLVMLVSAFDANRLQNTMNPPGVAYHALTVRNKWGLLGYRRDNWGATDAYLRDYTDRNTKVVNDMRLDTAIMNRWRYAPVVGEPCCNATYSDLRNQVVRHHAVSIGNGNFSSETTRNKNVTASYQVAGHRILITGGYFQNGMIQVSWRNDGSTPTYEHFDTYFELRNSTGQVVRTLKSNSSISMRLPGSWATTDSFTNLPGGSYELHVVVKNQLRSYPLGIKTTKLATIQL